MTEVAVPRWLFTAILQRIGRLRVSPNPAGVAGGTLPVRSLTLGAARDNHANDHRPPHPLR